jgi:hypothetical protein
MNSLLEQELTKQGFQYRCNGNIIQVTAASRSQAETAAVLMRTHKVSELVMGKLKTYYICEGNLRQS